MKRLLFIYKDKLFLDFIKSYLELKNYIVFISNNSVEGFRLAVKIIPDLIIIEKEPNGLDLEGFFIKKGINQPLKNIPAFLIGNFKQDEIKKISKDFIKAYISIPINPHALLERLNLFFKMNMDSSGNKKTPMLVDMHRKGNIIIIQIEGNLEADKLEIMNYEVRAFCVYKEIKNPKILLIIPSLYPEATTTDNIALIFKFVDYPEFMIKHRNIKLLSQCKPLIKSLKKMNVYKDIEIVTNFIDAIQKLNLDLDNKKEITVEHLKAGSSYIFDMFDEEGMVRIPALSILTQEMIDYLLKLGQLKLTYYSETDIEEIDSGREKIFSERSKENLEKMMTDYEPLDEKYSMAESMKEDKMKLFFSKLRNKKILIISNIEDKSQIISNALRPFVNLKIIKNGNEILELNEENYISIFLDLELSNPTAIDLLKLIRSKVSRRQTSVIITAKNITRETLNLLKNNGTDNILLEPFNMDKVLKKVFESVSADRNF